MGQEIAVKEDFGFLDEFRPDRFKEYMAKINAMSSSMVRAQLKDEETFRNLATVRAILVSKAVNYYDSEIRPEGNYKGDFSSRPGALAKKSVDDLEKELGFSQQTFSKWRKHVVDLRDYAEMLVNKWLKAADIIEAELKKAALQARLIEKAMRLIAKMAPDEYDEFKLELLAFDKARRYSGDAG